MNEALKVYQTRILKKPFLNFVLLYSSISLFLIFLGLYYYNSQKDKIVELRFEYLGSMAEFRSSQVREWVTKSYSDLEIIKINSPLINLSKEKFSLIKNIPPNISQWFLMLKKYNGYDNLMFLDSKMKFLYGLTPPNLPFAKTDSLLFKTVIDSNVIRFSDADEKTADQNLLRFYVPIQNQNVRSEIYGVLVITIKPLSTFEPILNRNIDKSPTIESLLVKAINDSVAYLNKLRFSNRETEPKYEDVNKALYNTSSITNRAGFVTGIDYKNEKVIAYIQKIPSTAWFLITKLNQSEFYEPVNNVAKIVTLIVISSNLFIAIILFFIWRKNIVANVRRIYNAEIERSKLEDRFKTLVNGVKNIGIFLLDKDGKVISWNEGAEKIKGYTADEVFGKHFSIFYTYEDRLQDKPSSLLNEAIKSGNVYDEGWRVRKDGSVFWANVFITSLMDEQNKVYGFLKITHDLTEKRNHEEELKNSRDFYLKLLDDFPNPVWRSGVDGKCNYFNKAWLNFTGKAIENELGDGWISDVHPEDRDNVVKEYFDSFQQRREFTLEYRLKNATGDYRWFVDFGMPYYDIKGTFAGFLGSCYDINDRIKYEETINTLLRISEKLYSSLEINQILDSLVTESIQLTNAQSGFACIKNETEYYVKRYFNIDHWEYLEKRYSVNDQIIQKFILTKDSLITNNSKNEESLDNDIIKKYGVRQSLSTPLFGTNSECIGFFEIHNKKNKSNFNNEDANLLRAVAKNASIAITKSLNFEKLRETEIQLRISETELRNLAVQIQYAREAERQHIAREVHDELGQLFTGINLNISLLAELFEQENQPTEEEILKELHSVQEFVNEGIQAVRDISGSLRSYVLDHLGLIPAIQEYCREVERISAIKCNFESHLDSLNLDEEKNVAMFRIIQEALTNVMRHAEATTIDLVITEEDNNLKFSVTDNGKGINRSDESLNNSMGILGMKERAIFLGGKLIIESKEGKGTSIFLSVPLPKIFS